MHKDFDAARRERAQEPLSFTLAGQSFTCLPVLPWTTLEKVIEPYAEGGELGVVMQIRPFMTAVLIDEDVERFEALIEDKADPIDLETCTAIVEWLMEVYTGRPTERPSASSERPSSPGPNLRPVSASPAATHVG